MLRALRPAALLGVACLTAACDVIDFVSDPRPTFQQTWNIPTSNTSISVATLLPNSVSIFSTPGSNPPDSGFFAMSINNTAFARRVGDDCATCVAQNGTTTTKPAFVLAAGGSSALPTDVVTASLASATVNYSVVNNLSFDPLRIRPLSDPTQGYMIVVVRSGSVVLGRDSVNGSTTAFPPGSTIARPVPIGSGTLTGAVQIDLTINSPSGDPAQPVPMNANGTVSTTVAYAGVHTSNVSINVVNKQIANSSDTLDLQGLNETLARRVVFGRLEMSVTNPWPIAGDVDMNLKPDSPQSTVHNAVLALSSVTTAPQVWQIDFDKTAMQGMLGSRVALTMSGPMTASAPVTVTPKQAIVVTNRIMLVVTTGSGQ